MINRKPMGGGRKPRVFSTSKRGKQFGESEEEQSRSSGPSITELPRPISCNILLRLSVNRLLVCRCVCKTWRRLISDPEFAKMHFAKGEVYPLIRSLSSTHVSRTLYLVESPDFSFDFKLGYMDLKCCENWDYCDHRFKRKLDTKLKIPLRNFDLALNTEREANANIGSKRKRCTKLRAKDHKYNVANSCNGLLCLSEPMKNDPVAVCNPITGEYIYLPVPTEDKDQSKKLVDCALGFSPWTNQYKVIRMFSLEDRDRQLVQEPITGEKIYGCRVAEIHVLGTSSWRMIGYAPSSYQKLGFPTCLNGALHWLYLDYKSLDYIVSFDLVSEKFRPILPPPKCGISRFVSCQDISLGELRGCLCMGYGDDFEYCVWVMEDYGVQRSWTKKHRLSTMTPESRWLFGFYELISVLSNAGLLLFHHRSNSLFCYHPEERFFKVLKLCGVKSKYEAIAYVPSFISLKDAVAGQGVEVFNINSRCAGLKLLGESKTLYLESTDADMDSDFNRSSCDYGNSD